MKKILFLGGLTSGGAEHQMVTIACLLQKEGYDVTYLCSGNDDFFQKELDESKIPVIRIYSNKLISFLKLNIPRISIIIYRLIKKNKYDTVISFIGNWNFINCITNIINSSKHKTITGIRNNRDSVWLSLREKIFAYFERYADYKVSNSLSAQKKYERYFPEHTVKLITIYNFVDLPEITSTYICMKNDKINIIIPASYRQVKNPMRLLNALSELSTEEKGKIHIDWYGNIKGGEILYNQMSDYIKVHKLEENISLHDAQKDIANRINEADIVGLFSTSEGLPNSICEGMMLGKAVIMTKVSDYDILVDNSNGFLCDYDNIDSIKNTLCLAIKCSKTELTEMGNASRIKAERLFSKNKIINQWKQII